jgi:hypothetical protein
VKDDRFYLHHMVERCRRITRFIAGGRGAFMASEQLQDAVIRNVGVIGEAGGSRRGLERPAWRIPELQAALDQYLSGENPGAVPLRES